MRRRRQFRSIRGVEYYVYLLASRRNGTLYLGVTNDLIRRVHEHRKGAAPGFTKQYGVKTLVWYESTPSVYAAISREKQLKNWKREWKLALIEQRNPEWRDLYEDLVRPQPLDAGSSPA